MSTHVLKVIPEHKDLRLDVYVTQSLPEIVPSRNFVKKLIENGHVRVNEGIAKAHTPMVVGDVVAIDIPANFQMPNYIEAEDIPLNIFYEDDYLLIINKVSGMIVHPAAGRFQGTLVNALKFLSVDLSDVNSEMRPGIIHRLDEETSGLLVVGKDNITHTKLAKQFQRHEIFKKYIALVEGEMEFEEGIVDVPIGRHPRHRDKMDVRFDDAAKESLTKYKVLKRSRGVTLVALYPKTGRTHQLRVHMRYLKHPILGDAKYGRRQTFPRLALHAQALGFKHPHLGQWIEFSCRPPQEFLDKVKA
jgi:23S rRNA pseudouridine1911/1915/1917 synthase